MKVAKAYPIGVFVSIFVAVAIIWGISGVASLFYFRNLDKAASFGDAFGATTSLFSGLAFGGVIAALILQTQELRLQRTELRATRIELRRSAKAQEAAQLALQLTAYLNACTAVTQSYASIIPAEKNRLRPANYMHQLFAMRLRAQLSSILSGDLRVNTGDDVRSQVTAQIDDVGRAAVHRIRLMHTLGDSLTIEHVLHDLTGYLVNHLAVLPKTGGDDLLRNRVWGCIERVNQLGDSIPSGQSNNEVMKAAHEALEILLGVEAAQEIADKW